VGLRGQVVNLVGPHRLDDADQARGVRHVAVVQHQVARLDVRVLVQVVDAVGIEQRGATLDAVDLIPLADEELGEIGAVLAGDSGDQRALAGGQKNSRDQLSGGGKVSILRGPKFLTGL
jgi:hypothetical protein